MATEWIQMGKANQKELQTMLDSGLTFSKIFDVEPYNKGCPAGFKPISKRDNGRGATCLKLKV